MKCPNTYVPNGYIDSYCNRNPGDICSYSCYFGYMATHPLNSTEVHNIGQGTIKCNSSSAWEASVSSLCVTIRCPSKIANGNISSSCTRLTHSHCGYYCNNGYGKSSDPSNLECDSRGQWVLPGFSASSKALSFCVRETELCPASIQNGKLKQCLFKNWREHVPLLMWWWMQKKSEISSSDV